MLAPTTANNDFAQGIKALLEPVQPHLAALNQYLADEINALEPEVRELAQYCIRHTGKQIRPTLVFYSGWQGADSQPLETLVKAAATLELVHQATLVHDDILDGATIRHNSPTLNEAYNAHTAVLLGDVLFSHALHLASQFDTVNVCRAVSQATRRVCAGEVAQTFQHRKPQVSLEDYYRVIDLKTAELFRVSCALGAELGGYNAGFTAAAAHFGRHMGIAYQIFDDLADLTGSESSIGKTLGTDLEGGKFTLPILLLLEKVDTSTRTKLLSAIQNGTPDIAQWASLIHKHEIPAIVEATFTAEIQKAENALAPFESLPAYAPLMSLSTYIRHQTEQLSKESR